MKSHLVRAAALLLGLLLLPASPGATGAAPIAQAGCRLFSETGQRVCGRFLLYWQERGGLAQQGLPLTAEFIEASEVDGKTYTVQYFERAVFEHHPENHPPHDVLLSLLGSLEYRRKYPSGAPGQVPNRTAGSVLFRETGRRVGGRFLDYWRANGGLSQQGFPISDEFVETGSLDGKPYRVQYFERAVFELHPENRPPHDVLLSHLGTFALRRKYPSGPPPSGDPWAALRARPVSLPDVSPGGACPKMEGKAVSPDFGPALGSGPVYAAGFGQEGVTRIRGALEEGGWLLQKVLWVGDPEYTGPVLVRGKRIDAPGDVRFGPGAAPEVELRLHTDGTGKSATGWYHWPTYTRMRGPGCYAFQVDGAGFSDDIVFEARDE